jgi:hypothetical protein
MLFFYIGTGDLTNKLNDPTIIEKIVKQFRRLKRMKKDGATK